MMTIWRWVQDWFLWLLCRKPRPFATVFLEELPEELDVDTVYIAGEGGHQWFAAMLCPCGCGETLYLNLQSDRRPRWSLTCHSDTMISLSPSVWRQVGCKSHFFFRRGHVRWCTSQAEQAGDDFEDG